MVLAHLPFRRYRKQPGSNLPCHRAAGVVATAAAILIGSSTIAIAQTDYCVANSGSTDTTGDYCTKPNFPSYGTVSTPMPSNPAATPGQYFQMTPGSKNVLWLMMGTGQPNANMTTSQSARDMFYMNYITGNLDATIGSPMDTGQSNNNTFAAVARHYPVGDPNDLHVMKSDGLHLRAICSNNHSDCSPGHVYAAMIRVPLEIRPGMTVKVRYKSPAGKYSWAPIWLFSGQEISPGPGGNPYLNYGTSTSLVQLPTGQHEFEIDMNDNYPRWYNSQPVTTGYQVDYGTPHGYGVVFNTQPHPTYWANSNGYAYHAEGQPPFLQTPQNLASGFHDLILSWDTSNMLYLFLDGQLVAASYMEYPANTYVDGYDNNTTKTVAMHLIIGNQAIPSFAPDGSSTTENDGIPDGWTIVVQEIAAWEGNILNPMGFQAGANGCDEACQNP